MFNSTYVKVAVWMVVSLVGLQAHAQGFSWMVNGIPATHTGGREYSVTLPSGSTFADVIATPGSEKGDHVYMRYTFNNSLSLASVPGWWTSSQDPWIDWTGDHGWEWRDSATAYSKRINGIPSTGSFRVIVECQNYDWTQSFVVNISVNTPTNQAPYTSWHTLPPTSLQSGNWYAARATGHDSDGNLGGIWVEYRVNGGAWSPLAYDPVGANGGNGFATTSNNNGIVAGPAGTTYQFRSYAYDTAGDNSGDWSESGLHSVPAPTNQDPTGLIEVLDLNKQPLALNGSGRAALTSGQQFYVRITGNDAEGALKDLYLRMQQSNGGAHVGFQTVSATSANPVSGGSFAQHDFGPFTANVLGTWDVWAHVTDQTSGGWTPGYTPGWVDMHTPDIEVSNTLQSQSTVTISPSATSIVAGQNVTFLASGGSGSINYLWSGEATGHSGSSPTISFPSEGTFSVSVSNPANGIYSPSNTASVTVSVGGVADTSAPTAPSDLQLVSQIDNTFTVQWNHSTDNVGVSHYEVWLQGATLRATVDGQRNQAVFDGFGPGSTNYITVVAVDAAGNTSADSNQVIGTSSASEGLGTFQEGHVYLDVDNDGVLDRVTASNSAVFWKFVIQWHTEAPVDLPYFFANFETFGITIDLGGGSFTDNFGTVFVPIAGNFNIWNSYSTYYDMNFVVWGEPGETLEIFRQAPLTNQDASVDPSMPINRARWDPIFIGGKSKINILDYGIQHLIYRIDQASQIANEQYFLVRYGEDIRGVDLDIAGEFSLELGLGNNVEGVTFPSGMSFSVGSGFGDLELDTGEILQVIAGVLTKASGGTIPTGTTQTIGGNTVSVDISGNVKVETPGGLVVEGNINTGAKSVVTSTGWGVSVDANGVVKLIIPPGASPLAQIVANAVDILGKVVQIDQGAIWSVKDLLGNVVNIPATGTPIDLLDIQVGPNGIASIGIKPSPESDTIWMEFPPTVQMESIDRMVHGSIDLSRFTFGGVDVGLQLVNNVSGETYGPYEIGNGNGVHIHNGFDSLMSDAQTDEFIAGNLSPMVYEQDVVFVRDSGNSDLIHFYTTFEATGGIEAVVTYNGEEIERTSHTLEEDLAFDELIAHVDLRIDERELAPPGLPADLHPDDVYASLSQGGASEMLSLHRPGTLLAAGKELSESEENEPVNLLLSLNNGLGSDGLPNNADSTLNLDDSDLVKMVLRIPDGMELKEGTFSLDSNAWHAIRVYDDETRMPLSRSDLSLDLGAPAGALTLLAETGSITLWVEGMAEFGNVEFNARIDTSDGMRLADTARLQTVGPLAFTTYFVFVEEQVEPNQSTTVDKDLQVVRFGPDESRVLLRTPTFSAVGNRAVRHRNLATTTSIPLFTFAKQTGQIAVNYFKGVMDGAWDGAKADYDALAQTPDLIRDQIQAFYDSPYLAAKAIYDPIKELLDLTTQQKLYLVDTMLSQFLSQAEQNTLWQSELGDPGVDTYISGYTTGLISQKIVTAAI